MKNNQPEWLIVLFLLFVGIVLWLKSINSEKTTEVETEDDAKITKQSIASRYTITRPTLKKWIEHFQNELKIDEWTKKRFLTQADVLTLENSFGSDFSLVLNKRQIADRAFSDYKTVSENVVKNIDKIGISLDAWNTCSCFPPSVTFRILEVLG